jgi:DNA-binding NarL/FixJ family response regulator
LRELTALGVGSVAPPYSPEHLSRKTGTAVMFQRSVARLARLADMTLVQLRERHAFDDLPERMRQVSQLAAAGHGNKRIGAMLNISPNTVRNHLSEAYERLAIKNKTELAALLLRFDEPISEAGIE